MKCTEELIRKIYCWEKSKRSNEAKSENSTHFYATVESKEVVEDRNSERLYMSSFTACEEYMKNHWSHKQSKMDFIHVSPEIGCGLFQVWAGVEAEHP